METCQYCGATMVERGGFLACSNFPECAYAHPINYSKYDGWDIDGFEEAFMIEEFNKQANAGTRRLRTALIISIVTNIALLLWIMA